MKRLNDIANAILVPLLIFGALVFIWWLMTSALNAVTLL